MFLRAEALSPEAWEHGRPEGAGALTPLSAAALSNRSRPLRAGGSKSPIDPEQIRNPTPEESPEAFTPVSGPTRATRDESCLLLVGHSDEVSGGGHVLNGQLAAAGNRGVSRLSARSPASALRTESESSRATPAG
jgi:hypothetical protein